MHIRPRIQKQIFLSNNIKLLVFGKNIWTSDRFSIMVWKRNKKGLSLLFVNDARTKCDLLRLVL